MKNTTLLALAVIIILAVGFFVYKAESVNTNTNPAGTISGETQKVLLSERNGNYYPQEVKVKVNQPVRISLDSSVQGCYRTFTVPQFGVAKYLKTPNDYVEFTPTKPGTYTFQCGMGMGFGKIIVE